MDQVNVIKNIVFALFIGVLLLPLFQQAFEFYESEELKGSFAKIAEPVLTKKTWFDGTYQVEMNKYVENNIGFRNNLVRLHNQIAYSFYNQAKANGVVIGKKNYLYELDYIKAYLGRNFIGKKEIEEKVNKLKYIKQRLAEKNIDIIVVFAPGKASFYPEYIPDRFEPSVKTLTNYEYYLKEITENNINHIDFNSYFIENKGKTEYPLYPKCGIHWSTYGMALAADSLIHYIENLRNIDLCELSWDEVEYKDTPRDADYDIAEGMNLLFEIPTEKMGYPKLNFENPEGKAKPSVITVADSYYWVMFSTGFHGKVFDFGGFWYYNQEIYHTKGSLKVSEVDLIEEVEKQDIIILLATDATLYKFAFGFIDNLYDAYKNISIEEEHGYENKIQNLILYIKSSDDWMKQIAIKAKDRKITIDEMVRIDAEYLLKEKNKKESAD